MNVGSCDIKSGNKEYFEFTIISKQIIWRNIEVNGRDICEMIIILAR